MEPEAPQEEVSVTPEPHVEPELEPEETAVEFKQEPIGQVEPLAVEKSPRALPSPTETAPTMPEENRVRLILSWSC